MCSYALGSILTRVLGVALLLLAAGCQQAPASAPGGGSEAEQLASARADLESAEVEVAALRAQVATLEQQLADARLAIEMADVSGHDPRLEAAIARAEAAERDAAATRERERKLLAQATERLVAGLPPAPRGPRPTPVRGWRALTLLEGGCRAVEREVHLWTWECQARVSNAGDTPAGFWATFLFLDRDGNVVDRQLHHFVATAGLDAVYGTHIGVSGPVSDVVEQIQVKIGPGDP